jgi:ubiquinone/menaquinone biosynthesis C-methylase UbiE
VALRPEIDPDAFNAFEAAGWEDKADGYDDLVGRVTSRLADPLLDAVHVGRGTRLLDLATGPGYVAARAGERGAKVVGVDVAGAMVSLAARLHPGLDFRRADVHELPFEEGSFDAVVGNFAILHLGRPEQATADFVRVLRPGGRLALTTWDRPERARLLGLFLDAVAETGVSGPADLPAGPDLFRFADEAEFERLLRDSGLEHPAVTTISFTHRLASADELWEGFLRGSLRAATLIVHQPEGTQLRIREAFDRLVRDYESEDGLELPISVKLASGMRPRRRPS